MSQQQELMAKKHHKAAETLAAQHLINIKEEVTKNTEGRVNNLQ